jgi:predicted metal-dependent phosphoesterase TrpH
MNRPPGRCDLHIHSYYSDGTSAPADLVEKASAIGLAAVSVTDHDTLEGQQEALRAGITHGIEVIEGIEFSVHVEDLDTHILGYLIDPGSKGLAERVSELGEARIERAREIVRRLQTEGLYISFREILEQASRGTVGRPHIAKALVERGLVGSFQAAFGRYLGEGRPCYVPKTVFPIEQVTGLIRDAGGVAVWAHPGERANNGQLLKKMLDAGIQGIEVYHPNHGPSVTRTILAAAESSGLIVTGGSDFHFIEAKHVDLGDVTAPYSSVIALREAVI